jgi:hypothetical protein
MRMTIIPMRKKNHHHQCKENRSGLMLTRLMPISLQAVKTGKKKEASHTYSYLSPLSIIMLYFTSVTDLLVKETKRHTANIWTDMIENQTLFQT